MLPAPEMRYLNTGIRNRLSLARNLGTRPLRCTNTASTGGSRWEMWFITSSTPPDLWMFSAPLGTVFPIAAIG
jgi:hypothetical protein